MLPRFLTRPSVLASLAVHGGLLVTSYLAWKPTAPASEARLYGILLSDAEGPVDAMETALEPPEPRLAPPTVTEVPEPAEPAEPAAPEEPAELDAPPDPARPSIPWPDRVPVGVRTSLEPTTRPAPRAAAPADPTPISAAVAPSSVAASRAGSRVTTDALELPTNRPVTYPAEAVANGWQGTARLVLEILEDGSVGRVTLEASSGHEVLDRAAADAAASWRFAPRLVDGVPSRDRIRKDFRFGFRRSS